jgi:CDP-glucose 4,6-dehydratase
MLESAFHGKSVFVTGHTGFKGSWLCLWLSRLGARVSGYAFAPPTNPSHFSVCQIEDVLAEHHLGDVRDLDTLREAIRAAQPDVILHLAAQSVVRTGYQEPLETFSTNVMGTANVLEAIRCLNKPCAAVMVTSDKCYENREQVWGYREDDAMGEHDPYGGSKGAAELVIRSYRDSFFQPHHIDRHGIKIASARAGNVIGGGDWTPHALIVDVVKALAKHEPILVRSPNSYRPWQHVLQALSGYLTLAAKLLRSDDPRLCSGWNIGPLPGNEIPVRDVVDLFLAQWGEGSWKDISDPDAPREACILRLCIDKALWQLDWKPCWGVQKVILETSSWYRHWLSGNTDMREFGLQQIAQYESAIRELHAPLELSTEPLNEVDDTHQAQSISLEV